MSWVVADLMTRDVVTVAPQSSFETCLRTMRMHGVGALPVTSEGRLAGIVTRTDLLLRDHRPSVRQRYEAPAHPDSTSRRLTASDVMTARVITVRPQTTVTAAVREMFQHRINRLPVVDDEGRLVGLISRSDVLRMFLRSDLAIQREVSRAVVADMPFLGGGSVRADVADGVVTLSGDVAPGTLTGVLLRLVASVPGVVGVRNRLQVRRARKAARQSGS